MIRRLEEYIPALEAAAAAMPHPGILAMLWQHTAGGLPGGLTVYDCGSGVLLAVRRGAAVLLGRPDAAGRQELAAFARFAGIRCLYTGAEVRLAGWKPQPLACMSRPVCRFDNTPASFCGHTVWPMTRYFAAAQLVCGDADEDARNDFYAELCSRRNRGIGQVLAIGSTDAPEGCIVCSGPVPCAQAVSSPKAGRRGKLSRLLAALQTALRRQQPADRPDTPAELLPTIHLSDLFVAPDKRGGKRAAALLCAAQQGFSLPPEARQLTLYCAPELIPFYEKHGFAVCARLCRWQAAE